MSRALDRHRPHGYTRPVNLVRLPSSLPAALLRSLWLVVLVLAGVTFADVDGAEAKRSAMLHEAIVRAEAPSGGLGDRAALEPAVEDTAEGDQEPLEEGLLLPAPSTPARYDQLLEPTDLRLTPSVPAATESDRIRPRLVVRSTPARGPPSA